MHKDRMQIHQSLIEMFAKIVERKEPILYFFTESLYIIAQLLHDTKICVVIYNTTTLLKV